MEGNLLRSLEILEEGGGGGKGKVLVGEMHLEVALVLLDAIVLDVLEPCGVVKVLAADRRDRDLLIESLLQDAIELGRRGFHSGARDQQLFPVEA